MTNMNFRDYFTMPALEAERRLAEAGYTVAQGSFKLPNATDDQVGDITHLQNDMDSACTSSFSTMNNPSANPSPTPFWLTQSNERVQLGDPTHALPLSSG